MRVKGFKENSMENLEIAMNTWFEQNDSIEVTNFQYNYDRGVADVYSALILYKIVES
jgi:hypothetical protein